jgi:hypothetical protein
MFVLLVGDDVDILLKTQRDEVDSYEKTNFDLIMVNPSSEVLKFNYDLLSNNSIHVKHIVQAKDIHQLNDNDKAFHNKNKNIYQAEFDSLNKYLQHRFIAVLHNLDIENLSIVAKYLSINREHAKYMEFLNDSFKITSP